MRETADGSAIRSPRQGVSWLVKETTAGGTKSFMDHWRRADGAICFT
jgi:hypothetical protein